MEDNTHILQKNSQSMGLCLIASKTLAKRYTTEAEGQNNGKQS